MRLVSDPRLFNYVLIALNAAAALRWTIALRWWEVAYWLAALTLNVVVTWGYQRA